jgi:hypothetical protein
MDQYIEMVCPFLPFSPKSAPNSGRVRTLVWAYMKTAHTRICTKPNKQHPTLTRECPSPRQRTLIQIPILTPHPLTRLSLLSNLSGQSSPSHDAVWQSALVLSCLGNSANHSGSSFSEVISFYVIFSTI